jgi:hypothetical protein
MKDGSVPSGCEMGLYLCVFTNDERSMKSWTESMLVDTTTFTSFAKRSAIIGMGLCSPTRIRQISF